MTTDPDARAHTRLAARALLGVAALAAACGAPPRLSAPAPLVLDDAGLHLPAAHTALPLPGAHRELAVSADGARLAMIHADERGGGGGLVLLDLGAPERGSARVDLGAAPADLGWLPDGRLAVLLAEPAELLLLDGRDGRVLSRRDTGAAIASRLAVEPGGAAAWISHAAPGTVSRLDLADGTRSVVPTDPGADGLALRPGRDELWVAHRTAGSLAVIDTRTRSVVTRIACPGFPVRVEFTPDGELALVSCALSGELATFDADGRRALGRVALGLDAPPGAMPVRDTPSPWPTGTSMPRGPLPVDVLAADDELVWVGCAGGEALALVDVRRLRLVGVRPTVGAPDALAPRPAPPPLAQPASRP